MPLISGTIRFCKKNACPRRVRTLLSTGFLYASRYPPWIESGAGFRSKSPCLTAPAGQKTAPAAGLGVRGIDLFREFIADGFVIDTGIVGRPDDGDHGRNARRGTPDIGNIMARPEQRRRRYRRRFGWRRGRRRCRGERRFDDRGCSRRIVLRRRWRRLCRTLARRLDAAPRPDRFAEFFRVDLPALVRHPCRNRGLPLKGIEPS